MKHHTTRAAALLAALTLCTASALAAMPDEEFVKLCLMGTAEQVRQALKDCANPNAKNFDGTETALMEAVSSAEKLKILLSAGADVNARAQFGRTVLMKAAENGEEASVSALLSAGADVNIKSEGDPIAQTPAGWTAPMMAARHGSAGTFALLASVGADLSAKDADGFTVLMAAACGGDAGIVRKVLDAGATVDARDSDGRTALMYAALHGKVEAARMLLSAGANPSLKNSEGHDALWLARNHTEEDEDVAWDKNLSRKLRAGKAEVARLLESIGGSEAAPVRAVDKKTSRVRDAADRLRAGADSSPEAAAAANSLGVWYEKGLHGLRPNLEEAKNWYELAAGHGNALAMHNLGDLYRQGKGVKQDGGEAFRWYKKAAEAGHAIGLEDMADCYLKGIGVEANRAEALRLYREAAQKGRKSAAQKLRELGE